MQPTSKNPVWSQNTFPDDENSDDDMSLAQPILFVYARSMDPVDWDDVLGDHKLGDACDLVPDAGVAVLPATSLAEANPDCNVHVAPRRSRWAVRQPWPQKSEPEGSNCCGIPAGETGNNAGFLLLGS